MTECSKSYPATGQKMSSSVNQDILVHLLVRYFLPVRGAYASIKTLPSASQTG